MNLVIDVGNSFIKAAVFDAGKIIAQYRFGKNELEKELGEIYLSFPEIRKGIISNVTDEKPDFTENLKGKIHFLKLSPALNLPFKNLYASPKSLGNDRMALVAAAAKNYPRKNVLVIDAGTCLTFEFINSKNQYLGGAISPGLQMRFKALNTFTAKLPLVEPEDQVELTGSNTKNSILAGVILGMLNEIDGFIDEYSARYEDLTIIFTGGDAHFLSIRLKNGIFANSNFLLEGLDFILQFNSNQ